MNVFETDEIVTRNDGCDRFDYSLNIFILFFV